MFFVVEGESDEAVISSIEGCFMADPDCPLFCVIMTAASASPTGDSYSLEVSSFWVSVRSTREDDRTLPCSVYLIIIEPF